MIARRKLGQTVDSELVRTVNESQAAAGSQGTLNTLRKGGADQHLLEALRRAEADLEATHRRLRQETPFAVPRRAVLLEVAGSACR